MPCAHYKLLTGQAIWPRGSETDKVVSAVALPVPTTVEALFKAVTDPALPPIGRVFVRNPGAPKARWRWDGETAEGEAVRLDAPSDREAGWGLERHCRLARLGKVAA